MSQIIEVDDATYRKLLALAGHLSTPRIRCSLSKAIAYLLDRVGSEEPA